jgi:hypothetical protein
LNKVQDVYVPHPSVHVHCSERCVDAATSENLPFPTLDE